MTNSHSGKRHERALAALLLCSLGLPMTLSASNTHFEATLKTQALLTQPTDSAHSSKQFGVGLEAEFSSNFDSDNLIGIFTPYARWANENQEVNHADVRELHLLHTAEHWEGLVGISRVFWGVTESGHLVDIINQTDQREGFDGEDKLGQPMIRLSRILGQDTLDLFLLSGFRERKFLPASSPLALPFPISNNNAVYGASNGRQHLDIAVRFSGYRNAIDYGISWFSGTSRDPDFISEATGVYLQRYPLIDQLGLDLQVTLESWLWKLEAIHRTFDSESSTDTYTAAITGAEYSLFGLANGLFDLGLLAEWHTDSRDNLATVPLQNDLFTGLRLGFNDTQSSEVLAGAFFDLDDDSTSLRVEASRRVFGDARISLEAQSFTNIDPENAAYYLRDSDFLLLSLHVFF